MARKAFQRTQKNTSEQPCEYAPFNLKNMDYEKKYNDALNWMRELYPGLHGATKEDAEHYFPELRERPLTPFQQCLNLILHKVYYASVPGKIKDVDKFILDTVKSHTDELVALAKRHEYTDCQLRESEDERIIEEIKFAVMQMPSERQDTKDRCLAWLEKQKEHHIPWYDYQKSKEAGYTIVPNEEYEQLIKQKEQKPEDKEITLTNFEEVLNTFLFDFANSPIEDCEPKEYTKKHSAEILKAAYAELNAQLKQDIFEAQQEGRREGYEAAKAEQKPAEWSEEDEKTIWGFTAWIPNEELERLGVTRDDILKKLKSLRSNPIQLKEAYIDGFDTARHATALAFMNYCDKIRPNGKMCLSNGECEDIEKAFLVGDWEKIERYFHKYHWKPSEEQKEPEYYQHFDPDC